VRLSVQFMAIGAGRVAPITLHPVNRYPRKIFISNYRYHVAVKNEA